MRSWTGGLIVGAGVAWVLACGFDLKTILSLLAFAIVLELFDLTATARASAASLSAISETLESMQKDARRNAGRPTW